LAAFTSNDFLGALEKSGCQAPFSGEDFFRTVGNRGERVQNEKWLKTSAFGAQFAPICALLKNDVEKHGENREKSAKSWR
jgi:hypothetical protein